MRSLRRAVGDRHQARHVTVAAGESATLPPVRLDPACADELGRYTLRGLGPYAWPVEFTDFSGAHAWQWPGGASNRHEAERVRPGTDRRRRRRRLAHGGRPDHLPPDSVRAAYVVNAASSGGSMRLA